MKYHENKIVVVVKRIRDIWSKDMTMLGKIVLAIIGLISGSCSYYCCKYRKMRQSKFDHINMEHIGKEYSKMAPNLVNIDKPKSSKPYSHDVKNN